MILYKYVVQTSYTYFPDVWAKYYVKSFNINYKEDIKMKTENFVVITFDDEKKAIEASHKLQDLHVRGDISMGYSVMLRKGPNGEIEALKKSSIDGDDTWSGMLIGMLVGLFFGPLGFLISMLAGTAIGAGVDYSQGKFEDDFVNKVKEKLDNGRIAIISNCNESSTIFIDTAMKEFNGDVYRTIATK